MTLVSIPANPVPENVVTGTIKARRRNDNATTFADVLNPGGARLDLLNDPAFRVAV